MKCRDHGDWQSDNVNEPPRAAHRPFSITRHGDTRVDPYYWLMDRDDPEVIAHLELENAFLAESLAPLKDLEDEVFEDIKSRIEETDTSVPVRDGGWWYFDRTREGLNYTTSCRAPATVDTTPPVVDPATTLPDEQVVFDKNAEAEGHDFLSVGVLDVSPDGRWVAAGVDFDGNELHRLTFRPLDGQQGVDDAIDAVDYGFTWAPDSHTCFYTTTDAARRPYRVWRHSLGTPASDDVLIFQEDDSQYTVTVGCTRDDDIIIVYCSSSMTTETHWLPARAPESSLTLFEARRHGVEYSIDHYRPRQGPSWWLKVTNESATDFRLLARRDDESEWRELIAHRPGTRLEEIDTFADVLAISERLAGSAAVRLVALREGDDPFGDDLLVRSRVLTYQVAPNSIGLSANPTYDSHLLRVSIGSMTTPRIVADVDARSGELIVRKQQRVLGGFDEADYWTDRLWVTASDGVEIPVTLVARRDLVSGDSSTPTTPLPMVLYGYGSYEISMDPVFHTLALPLLDRGVVFAIAHIRGGGEMGRAWYEMGKLAQKPTTFSDFVTVGRDLVGRGWTTPGQLAIRGGSAGGLLMGAVMNLAPDLCRAAVAMVPFVDCLTTMLDDTLPLTIGEYEEWGNPSDSATTYRTMKSYSPYDNVSATNADGSARTYPHVFATGGLNDTRVGFWEPAKWVLRLRDASPDNVIYLKTEMGTGHAGASGRYDAWRDEAQILAFIISEITGPH
jgi:oligopeptidase B